MQTDFGPAAFKRFEVDAAIDERLRQVTSARFERVDAQSEGPWCVGGVEKLQGFVNAKEFEQLLGQVRRVAVVLADVPDELFDQIRPRPEFRETSV